MTSLAIKILNEMNKGKNAQEIIDMGIGNSVHEVEFIMEQIKFVQGK